MGANMSIDLKEMFNEKNQDLFLKKMIMDLENNTDTFKLSSKNIIKIEIAKLLSSLRRVYFKYSLEINEEHLKELLSDSKNKLLTDINLLVDKKFDNNKEYIKNIDRSETINIKYIKSYHKHINDTEEDFEDNVKIAICEISEIGLYKKLTKLQPCVNEEMHQDILKIINMDFSNTLISRIIDESIHRNRTLKNISEETYSWYSNLNKTSAKIEQSSKKKMLKNN